MQVDGILYCVHRYFFSRDSVYFSTRFDQLGIRDHEALPIAISLSNVESKDLDAFLSILYPE
jgi:BTB/POZ domain